MIIQQRFAKISGNEAEIDMKTPGDDLIVFDAECILCSGFARFMTRHDHIRRFSFVSAQSDLGHQLYERYDLDPMDWSTNIVIVNGIAYTKMAAFGAAMRAIGWPWRILAIADLIPQRFGNWCYDRIAQNRYIFDRRNCPLPSADLRGRLIE